MIDRGSLFGVPTYRWIPALTTVEVEYLIAARDAGEFGFEPLHLGLKSPALAGEWLPRILANAYDARNVPYSQKAALTVGMGMTERQGGSDVRANTTRAILTGRDGGA